MTDRELMQQALEALTTYDGINGEGKRKRVLTALRERLAEPQEPDYWREEARRYAGNADYWRRSRLAAATRSAAARLGSCWSATCRL